MLALLFSDIQSRFLSVGKVTGVAVGDGGGGDGIAYLKSDGSDYTGTVGYPGLPFATLDAAITALGEAGTVELLDNVGTTGPTTFPYAVLVQGAFDLTINADTTMLLDGLTVGTATCDILYPDYDGVGETNVGTITLADGCVLSYSLNGATGSPGGGGAESTSFGATGSLGWTSDNGASDGGGGGAGDNGLPATGGSGDPGQNGFNARSITVLGVGSIQTGLMVGGAGGEGGAGGLAISQGGAGGDGGAGYWNGSEYETDGGSGGSGGDAANATGGVGGNGGIGGDGGTLSYAATVTPRNNVQYQSGGGGAGGAGGLAYSTPGTKGFGGPGLNPGMDGSDGTAATATDGQIGTNGTPGNNGMTTEV